MKISDLELFTTVAREKSFSKAAQRLYISQSAVTQHIKKIETELGFALFERNTHFAALTEQGKIMLSTSQEMLKQYHKALAMCTRGLESRTKLTVSLRRHGQSTFSARGTDSIPRAFFRLLDRSAACSVG